MDIVATIQYGNKDDTCLETLTFGDAFNQAIQRLPGSLKSLSFGDDFQQPLEQLNYEKKHVLVF